MLMRTLFFDFGGTLVRNGPLIGRGPSKVWKDVAEAQGWNLSEGAIREALTATDAEFHGRIYQYHGRTSGYWSLHEDSVLDRLGVHERRPEFHEELKRAMWEAATGELYPEAVPVLEELQTRGISLGVISNNNDTLRDALARHGLTRFFRTVTYSQEAGAEKPDPRVFALALSRACCEAREAGHVGDSWNADYMGARFVGLRSIWLNRNGATPPEPCEWVGDLGELAPLLGT